MFVGRKPQVDVARTRTATPHKTCRATKIDVMLVLKVETASSSCNKILQVATLFFCCYATSCPWGGNTIDIYTATCNTTVLRNLAQYVTDDLLLT